MMVSDFSFKTQDFISVASDLLAIGQELPENDVSIGECGSLDAVQLRLILCVHVYINVYNRKSEELLVVHCYKHWMSLLWRS